MKSFILASTLLLTTFFSETFATDSKVAPLVVQAFEKTFSHASYAKWDFVDQLYRVAFTNGTKKAIAFFSGDGTLVATSRYIYIENLPSELQYNLVSRTTTGSVVELFEVETDGVIEYYATVNQSSRQLIYKSTSKDWKVYRRK